MKNLKAKLQKKGGFTLIEMLIVVAIIAILIAVSIPMVGTALENAREATDAANERAFKGALTTAYLTTEAKMGSGDKFVAGTVYCYDAAKGTLEPYNSTAVTVYGQGTSSGRHTGTEGDHKGMRLYGYVDATEGTVYMAWLKNAANNQDTIKNNANRLTSNVLVNPDAT